MWLVDSLLRAFVFGSTGMLAEVYFTAGWSLWHRDPKGTATTYIWMLPIYGLGGLLFGKIHDVFSSVPFWILAALYTLLIYVQEWCWHWLLEKLLKVRVWDYGRGSWTFMGRVQPKYCLAWYLFACAFGELHGLVTRVFELVAKYGLN